MSRRRGRRGERTKAAIDMTSMIDLTFLLLVTFMLTLPKLEQGVSILLPQAKTDALPSKNNKANTITISQTATYFNNQPVTDETLEKILLEKVAEDPEVPVLVRGDERLSYGTVMGVVKIVYKCKVRRMALVTVDK
ncbi:MAG: biopolymer transporter ExbD [Kiritimatiellae bacterium]|nr:biopolymer transporter ExbD [Kiritimatiellia bacterium]